MKIKKKRVIILLVLFIMMVVAGCSGDKKITKLKGTYQSEIIVENGGTSHERPLIQFSFVDNRFEMTVNHEEYDTGYTQEDNGNFVLVGKKINDVLFDFDEEGCYFYFRDDPKEKGHILRLLKISDMPSYVER